MSIGSGTRADIVTLVGNMTNITEHDDSRDLARTNAQRSVSWLVAAIEVSTTTSENITHDLGTQRVTGQDKLGVGAFFAISTDLGNTGRRTIGGLGAVTLGAHEHDVLIVAAGKTVTGGISNSSYTTWVFLAVSTGQEEMDIGTRVALLQSDDCGHGDRDGEEGEHCGREEHVCWLKCCWKENE